MIKPQQIEPEPPQYVNVHTRCYLIKQIVYLRPLYLKIKVIVNTIGKKDIVQNNMMFSM